ncbi:hypothetical protein [Ruegeria sp. SCSIO 43209]|uniref:hypothetical protein n=1 Tax=Ruegeria sp. SCSIO 43209 TaxID=2793010 RepID=UPI001CA9E328|nr:hypothetical protein [Ruegeria sp. SCSIO 43209]
MQSTTVPVPEDLEEAFERYGELIKAESTTFRQRTLPAICVFTAIFMFGPILGFFPPLKSTISVAILFSLPFLAFRFFGGKLSAEREEIQCKFSDQGLRICHDMSHRVDVVRE